MAVVSTGAFLRVSVASYLLIFLVVDVAATSTKRGFYFEFIGEDFRIVRLRCQVGIPTGDLDVVSISIYNVTSDSKMAWVTKDRGPSPGSQMEKNKDLYLAGGFPSEHHSPAVLQVLILDYESFQDQSFGCKITKLRQGTKVDVSNWTITINKTVDISTPTTVTTTAILTDAPSRVGAAKGQEIDTDSLPMTVLIVMLVLITILLFLAVFLLLHRYRTRCQRRDEDVLYHPPAYCLAPDAHLDWTDAASTLKSKGSARTLNSRGHYSIAAHHFHMPLPPLPHSAVPRKNSYKRPPSIGSGIKVPYAQPQDAIGQESSGDGEIAALSSGSTKVQYTSNDLPRQHSPLYACVPVSSADD